MILRSKIIFHIINYQFYRGIIMNVANINLMELVKEPEVTQTNQIEVERRLKGDLNDFKSLCVENPSTINIHNMEFVQKALGNFIQYLSSLNLTTTESKGFRKVILENGVLSIQNKNLLIIITQFFKNHASN